MKVRRAWHNLNHGAVGVCAFERESAMTNTTASETSRPNVQQSDEPEADAIESDHEPFVAGELDCGLVGERHVVPGVVLVGSKRLVTDGPFAETKEQLGG
jgi:hypothetical protein